MLNKSLAEMLVSLDSWACITVLLLLIIWSIKMEIDKKGSGSKA
ncbi:MAG: hypothetical protein R2766_06470 [Saprospiraceae bacterium]